MTARELLTLVQYDVFEDGLLRLGILTEAQFLDALNLTLLDCLKETCCVKDVFTQSVFAGVGSYALPAGMLRVDAALAGGVLLAETTTATLANARRNWRREPGPPQAWYQDQVPPGNVGLAPVPDENGGYISGTADPDPPHGRWGDFWATVDGQRVAPSTHRGLSLVGPLAPDPMTNLDQSIPLLPEGFARAYLWAGVLERIFAADSELKNEQAALYCGAAWKEGLSLLKSMLNEAQEETL